MCGDAHVCEMLKWFDEFVVRYTFNQVKVYAKTNVFQVDKQLVFSLLKCFIYE